MILREIFLGWVELITALLVLLVVLTVVANLISGGIHNALNVPPAPKSTVPTVKPQTRK